jgi:pimeloyl-ACP methyl ester carboxylesterase
MIAVGLVAALTVSCGGNAAAPTAPLLSLITLNVPGAQGGTLSLLDGTSVKFAPGALVGTETVTLSENQAETASIPVPGWATAHGTMTVVFNAPVAAGSSPSSITLVLAYAKDAAASILAAQAPVIEITTANGSVERVSADEVFDAANGLMTATLEPEQIAGALKLKMYAAVDGSGLTKPSYGPQFWDQTKNPPAWIPDPFTVDATKRTVVMLHGIFSSVEQAFPCEQTLLQAGGYAQGLGLNYDWTQPPDKLAPIFANYINSLPVASLDIEAHSYGTIVALAALPMIQKKVNHIVLLGGPLPLNGSPQARPGFLRDLVLIAVWLAYPSDVYRARKSGMLSALATNSPAMQAINNGLQPLALPPFIQAAGGSPLPQQVNNYAVYALYKLLYGNAVNDGVVVQKSANQMFRTTTARTFTKDNHIQLECDDPAIISYVGSLVQR